MIKHEYLNLDDKNSRDAFLTSSDKFGLEYIFSISSLNRFPSSILISFTVESVSLSKEWDKKKNKNKTPYNTSYGSNKGVFWICSKCSCGWKASPSSRTTASNGCPVCKESKGEKKIRKILISFNLKEEKNFKSQYRIEQCRDKRMLPFDFCIFKDNKQKDILFLIEFNGEQHYDVMRAKFFNGKNGLKSQKRRDKIKQDYCYNNNINLLIIPYWQFNEIEQILTDTFNELS